MNENNPIITQLYTEKPFNLRMESELSKPIYRRIAITIVLIFFFIVIAGPIINIISNVIDNVYEIRQRLFLDEILGDAQWIDVQEALWESFSIAFIAVLIDMVIGFPIAIVLTRCHFPGRKTPRYDSRSPNGGAYFCTGILNYDLLGIISDYTW